MMLSPRLTRFPGWMGICWFTISAAAVSWGQIVPVNSTSALKHMTVEELLRETVIAASRSPEELGSVPGNVYLIRGDAARASGANTLPQLLRLAPNLFVAQASAYDWAVGARGFARADSRVNKMQVTIDGRTVYSPLFSGVFWDSQDVFLPDLDRIEVLTGPVGASWGSNAVNGVINIATKSARVTQGGVAYAGVGSELKSNAGIRYGSRIRQGAYYRVYLKRMSFDGTLAANGRGPASDAWHFTQGGFRVDGGNDRSALEWTFQGDGYEGYFDGVGSETSRNRGANLMVRWVAHFSNDSDAILRIYHDHTDRRVPDLIRDQLRTTDVELQHSLRLGQRHEFLWGVSYRYMDESVPTFSDAFAILPVDATFHVGALFAEDTFSVLPDRVRLTAGVRLEHNTYSKWELQPSVRLAWEVTAKSTIWSSVSRATRTPSRIDSDFFARANPPYAFTGSGNFESEVLDAYELGWRAALRESLSLSLAAYYHDYSKLRSVEPGPPNFVGNGLDGHSAGVELFLDWQATHWWRFRAGVFGLEQGTSMRPGGMDLEAGLGEDSFPRHQILLRSGLDLSRNCFLWLSVRSVGRVPAYENGIDVGAVPAYTELDANLRWTIRPHFEISLTGRNLLDASHPEIGASALDRREIERAVFTSARWDF